MKSKYLIGIMIVCFCIQSCCRPHSVNPYVNVFPSFDKNGVKTAVNYFSMQEPAEIHVYTETSGSMNYLYRPGCATDFKYNISSLIEGLSSKIHEVNIFDGENHIYHFPLESFRVKMNKGPLMVTNSTPIPQILDSVLVKLAQNINDVSILISDMKFAPSKNIGATKAWTDQYEIDIRSRFQKHQDLTVTLLGMETQGYDSSKKIYRTKDDEKNLVEFPYYMLIIGKAEKVAWVKNEISHMNFKRVSGFLDFNIDYDCPHYTILPSSVIGLAENYLDTQNSPRKYSLVNYVDGMYTEFVLAIDSRHLAGQAILSKISSTWPQTKITMCVVPNFKLTESDNIACQGMIPDTFVKINLQDFDQDCEAISLMYESTRENSRNWITKYYGGMRESDFSKTVSIEGFVGGLQDAYKTYNIQNKPIEVLISKF